jgi:hypothetical protein
LTVKILKDEGSSSSDEAQPKIWILASRHAGDNTQLTALAEALGWPFVVKRLAYRRFEPALRLAGQASLAAVDRECSDPLAPPWPDLVIAAGRSTEAVARWLRRHANPALRLVQVGTPWSALDEFDLVVATPQYRLPQHPNVVHISLPLHAITAARLEAAAVGWRQRLAHLPRPYTAVLVGGASGPYRFTAEAAARLGREASALAVADGGSLLISTSARTSDAVTLALQSSLEVPAFFHRWRKRDADNPYLALLALAERLIVTADSVSMLSEAVATGKPTFLFDIEKGRQSLRAEAAPPGAPLPPIHWRGGDLGTTTFRLLMRHAPARWSRDLRIVHREVVATGAAAWLGEAQPRAVPAVSAMAIVTARIRALFGL